MEDLEDTCQVFVQMWAEAVIRQVKRVREIRKKTQAHWGVGTTNNLELAQNFRSEWAEEHTLIWSAYQLERWVRRLAEERGKDAPPVDKVLGNVRHTLEHLDEAAFEGNEAVPGERSRSLKALPNSRLRLGTGSHLAFGLIDVEELEDRALGIVRSIVILILDRFVSCGSCGHRVRSYREDNFSTYRCRDANCAQPVSRLANDVDNYVAQKVFAVTESAPEQIGLSGLPEEWITFPPSDRQELIRTLIQGITILPDNINIKWAWDA